MILIIFLNITIGWSSHLFLDALNPEGIPLGKTPVYLPHPVKHYSWRQLTNSKTFRLARIPFNNLKANDRCSHLGLFLLSLNIANLILNHFQVISEVTLFG
ncbi:MAG: hypothetical protein ACFFB2_02785 [Promethearchaeota archaeon]